MYFSQFTASFLRSGARVIGLCPEPEAAMARPAQGRGCGDCGIPRRRVHFHPLPTGKRSFFNGRFEGDPVRTFSRWRAAADTLADAEAASGLHADLVYFPYLDSYLRFLPFPAIPSFLLNRPWSGLYLRNHHHGEARPSRNPCACSPRATPSSAATSAAASACSTSASSPPWRNPAASASPPTPTSPTPTFPPEPYPLALEIQRKAAGRTIVGMIGLERRKGFLTSSAPPNSRGKRVSPATSSAPAPSIRSEFTEDEQAEIHELSRAIAAGEIDNLHFNPAAGRIPDEADYNSLFRTFNIAWAAYEGFEGSSGTLGKAAAFDIPCLATAGECVGNRVETYRLGLTIPEGNAEQALAVIPCLAAGKDLTGKSALTEVRRISGPSLAGAAGPDFGRFVRAGVRVIPPPWTDGRLLPL